MSMDVKKALAQLGVKPEKERGQNFLIDDAVIDSIIEFGKPRAGETLVEIGPGLGALTGELARIGALTVIEIESAFCTRLEKEFPEITVVCEDVRGFNFAELGQNLVVFGNLPYSFSTDIIFTLVGFGEYINRAVLLLQKEFVERLAAAPGGKDYGALTIAVQLYADVYQGPVITGDSFHPKANVDSRLVELRFLDSPRYEVKDSYTYQQLVRAAFFRRRKKIINSIESSTLFSDIDLPAAFVIAGIDSNRRAETLSITEYISLADAIASL